MQFQAKYKKLFTHILLLRQLGECGEVANLDCNIGLCPYCYLQEAIQSARLALHVVTDIVGHSVRENVLAARASSVVLRSWRYLCTYLCRSGFSPTYNATPTVRYKFQIACNTTLGGDYEISEESNNQLNLFCILTGRQCGSIYK